MWQALENQLLDLSDHFNSGNKELSVAIDDYNANQFYWTLQAERVLKSQPALPMRIANEALANHGLVNLSKQSTPYQTHLYMQDLSVLENKEAARQLAAIFQMISAMDTRLVFNLGGTTYAYNHHLGILLTVAPPSGRRDEITAQRAQAIIRTIQENNYPKIIDSNYHKRNINIILPDPISQQPSIQVLRFANTFNDWILVKSLYTDQLEKLYQTQNLNYYSALLNKNGEALLHTSRQQSAAYDELSQKIIKSGHTGKFYFDGFRLYCINIEKIPPLDLIHIQICSVPELFKIQRGLHITLLSVFIFCTLFLWLCISMLEKKIILPAYEKSRRILESEDLNRTLVSTSPSGIALFSTSSGKLILQNSVMASWESRAKDDTSFQRLLENEQILPAAFQAETIDKNLCLPLADGGVLDLHLYAVHTKYLGVPVLLCNLVDITAIKDRERQLEAARKTAESANRAKSSFLAMMSHEIRTPLNAILSSLELLARTPLQEKQQKRLDVALNSTYGLLGIINDILDLSKVEAGQISIESISFDLRALAQEAIQTMSPLAAAKGLAFLSVISSDLAPAYLGDPLRIRQIMLNLLSNAIKFTESGEVIFEVYHQDESDLTSPIRIGVTDSGIGISAEDQDKIFNEFMQADASITRRFGGTGLGLPLCKKLLGLLGGNIEFISEAGVGSTFIATLPLQASHSAVEANRDLPDMAMAPHRRLRLLVVDDHPVNCGLIQEQLQELGHDADTAANGKQALQLACAHTYDVIATDLNMPGMDGYTLAKLMRGENIMAPIIAITAHAGDEERALCAEAGINEVLIKPISLAALNKVIQTLMPNVAPVRARSLNDAPSAPIALSPARLKLLLDSLEDSLQAIQSAAHTQNARQAKDQLHAIKGVFAMLHLTQVAQACKALEDLAQADDWSTLLGQLPALRILAHQQLKLSGLWDEDNSA
ncbi:response regulator [Chromobacterium amazonense]|uniref:response regulator n=1 Tax=Chromobacterium amazonense TaxID=1382803 RepID=UPI003F7AD2DE